MSYNIATNANLNDTGLADISLVLHKMSSINKPEDDEICVGLVIISFKENILSIFE